MQTTDRSKLKLIGIAFALASLSIGCGESSDQVDALKAGLADGGFNFDVLIGVERPEDLRSLLDVSPSMPDAAPADAPVDAAQPDRAPDVTPDTSGAGGGGGGDAARDTARDV